MPWKASYAVVLMLSTASDDLRVSAAYNSSTATITCTVSPHPTNQHLNISVWGYDVVTGVRLTGLPTDPPTVDLPLPSLLDCEGADHLEAWCELFSHEARVPVYRRAIAEIPCDAPPAQMAPRS